MNGIEVTHLNDDVWFRVEFSEVGADDWDQCSLPTYGDMIRAQCGLKRRLAKDGDEDRYEYRIVRVTTQEDVVRYK